MYIPPKAKLCHIYEVKHTRGMVLGFKHGKFKNPPKSFIFGVNKKDPGLLFHFHVTDLFNSWSNLGFDQDSNGHKNSIKNSKNEKPKHISFLSYSKHSC